MSDRYAEFFLASPSRVVLLELLEISHPSFSKVYRIVRNATQGVTVTLENGQAATFDYYPLRIQQLATRDNLDFGIRVDLGDLGGVIPAEIDRVMSAGNATRVRPMVKYRLYRSDDLAHALFGPVVLEVESIAMKREGASFEAKAPRLDLNRTGETYTLDRFPGLRGLL